MADISLHVFHHHKFCSSVQVVAVVSALDALGRRDEIQQHASDARQLM
jgi:hypothetical protein